MLNMKHARQYESNKAVDISVYSFIDDHFSTAAQKHI